MIKQQYSGDEDILCCICLDYFGSKEDRPFMVRNCDHRFHQYCIKAVLHKRHIDEHLDPHAPCRRSYDADCMATSTAPCPLCRALIKKKHIRLDSVLSRIVEGFNKKLKLTLYGQSRPYTVEDKQALSEEAKLVLEDLIELRTEMIQILEEEIRSIKKNNLINSVCIGIEVVSGLLCIPIGPLAAGIGTLTSNVIRIIANHYKIKSQKERNQRLEEIIEEYNRKRDSQRLQTFLKLYSDSVPFSSSETKEGALPVMMILASFVAIPVGVVDALLPLHGVTCTVTTLMGVGLCIGSVTIQGILSFKEYQKGKKLTLQLEEIIEMMKNGDKEMSRLMREMVKEFTEN